MDLPESAIPKMTSAIPLRPLIQRGKSKTSPSEADQAAQLKKAARAFEAYFIKSLLKEMRKTQPKEGLFGGGAGKEIYQSLFDEKISQKMTESGGMGLSRLIIKKLTTGLKVSGETTDRREAIDRYNRLSHSVTVGDRNENPRK